MHSLIHSLVFAYKLIRYIRTAPSARRIKPGARAEFNHTVVKLYLEPQTVCFPFFLICLHGIV